MLLHEVNKSLDYYTNSNICVIRNLIDMTRISNIRYQSIGKSIELTYL